MNCIWYNKEERARKEAAEWTEEEMKALQEKYQRTHEFNELCDVVPHRSKASVAYKVKSFQQKTKSQFIAELRTSFIPSERFAFLTPRLPFHIPSIRSGPPQKHYGPSKNKTPSPHSITNNKKKMVVTTLKEEENYPKFDLDGDHHREQQQQRRVKSKFIPGDRAFSKVVRLKGNSNRQQYSRQNHPRQEQQQQQAKHSQAYFPQQQPPPTGSTRKNTAPQISSSSAPGNSSQAPTSQTSTQYSPSRPYYHNIKYSWKIVKNQGTNNKKNSPSGSTKRKKSSSYSSDHIAEEDSFVMKQQQNINNFTKNNNKGASKPFEPVVMNSPSINTNPMYRKL